MVSERLELPDGVALEQLERNGFTMKIASLLANVQGDLRIKAKSGSRFEKLKEGDTVRAEVLSSGKGTAALKTEDGQIIKAKLESGVSLSENDEVLLEVKAKEDGVTFLSITEQPERESTAPEMKPRAFALKDETLVPFAQKLAELSMPVKEETAVAMRALMAEYPDMSMEEAAFLASNNITGDKELIAAARALISGGVKTEEITAELIRLTGEAALAEQDGEAVREDVGIPKKLMLADSESRVKLPLSDWITALNGREAPELSDGVKSTGTTFDTIITQNDTIMQNEISTDSEINVKNEQNFTEISKNQSPEGEENTAEPKKTDLPKVAQDHAEPITDTSNGTRESENITRETPKTGASATDSFGTAGPPPSDGSEGSLPPAVEGGDNLSEQTVSKTGHQTVPNTEAEQPKVVQTNEEQAFEKKLPQTAQKPDAGQSNAEKTDSIKPQITEKPENGPPQNLQSLDNEQGKAVQKQDMPKQEDVRVQTSQQAVDANSRENDTPDHSIKPDNSEKAAKELPFNTGRSTETDNGNAVRTEQDQSRTNAAPAKNDIATSEQMNKPAEELPETISAKKTAEQSGDKKAGDDIRPGTADVRNEIPIARRENSQNTQSAVIRENTAEQNMGSNSVAEGMKETEKAVAKILAELPEFKGTPEAALLKFSKILMSAADGGETADSGIPEKLTAMLDKIFYKIDKNDENAGERLRQVKEELYLRLSLIEEAAAAGEKNPVKTEILTQTQKLMDQVRVFNNIEQFAYIQIPLKMGQEHKTADLYVYKRKKGSKKGEADDVNVLLALDLENMGHWESFIKIKGKDVSLQMEVENRRIKEHISENTVLLHNLLAEAGFKLGGTDISQSMSKTTPVTALSTLERHKKGRAGGVNITI